ncbi:exodeoxyribonuclease VII small subunit [Fusibacter ferrireducens]|uniref:Exodeoxyribonuclease 7 small subunit n=1 Tax=Fusibacter ferrireducens TaxID=2785058 RepID=A0ABR9ZTB0_9FIRM|nr:exodeoxyribonuclease VII small subunit [Fusibacter ferrireducens]MBF4693683.1 exodeoxyribonuclease VII small subunit [Fusibacter ferrireducens]
MTDGKKGAFEQKIMRLNEISNSLENGNEALEDMLKYFEEGIKVYRECFEILKDTETRIKMILEDDYALKEVNINDFKKS